MPKSGMLRETNGAESKPDNSRCAVRCVPAVTFSLVALVVAGCGGGYGSTPVKTPPPAILVAVTSASPTVQAGGAVSVSSTVSNDASNKGVTWSITPTSGAGTLSNPTSTSVTYDAPATPPTEDLTVTITATAVADVTKTASTTIVVPGMIISVSLDTGIVPGGGTAVANAQVDNDPSNKGVTWSIDPASGAGTLSGATSTSVTYNAPAGAPSGDVAVTITATSIANPAKSGIAQLTYVAIAVTVTPDSSTVEASSSTNVSGEALYDLSNKGVTWTVSDGGTLTNATSTSVTYNAPATAPVSDLTVTVTATSAADTTKSGFASIVVPAIAVSVSPGAGLIPLSATQVFTGHVANDPANKGVNWSLAQNGMSCGATCGTPSPASTASDAAMTYTAPASMPADSSVTLTAESVTDNTKSTAASIALTNGSVKLVPNILAFGTVKASASRSLPVALTNTGAAALNMTGITFTGANASAFTQTNDCGSSVAAGATCTITVTFKPTAGLSYDVTMSIADSSPDSPQQVALHGSGVLHHGPLAGGVAAALRSSAVNEVPRPSGPKMVGTRVAALADVTRDDPYLANGTKRELMVRFWYPAASGEVCKPAEYTSSKVWSHFSKLLELPLAQISTNSCADAAMEQGEHPVVLFTHGYTATFTDYTFLMEDLASRGYVVASVDHTYEATAVEFPDGKLVQSLVGSHLGGRLIEDSEALKFAVETRLADLKFVTRELTRMSNDPRGAFLGRLDTSRIALAGHSLGGWTALRGVNEEPIFKVGVAIDASVFSGSAISTEKPVLLVGADRELWSAEEHQLWASLRGPRFAVNLPGAEHKAPSDAVWLARYAIQTGRMSPREMIATVRDYIAAFLDTNLRGEQAGSLLKGTCPRHPGAVVTTQEQGLRTKN